MFGRTLDHSNIFGCISICSFCWIDFRHRSSPRVAASFSWERRVFGALVFIVQKQAPGDAIESIALNVFEKEDGQTKEYFAIPSQSWFNNILQGCRADTLVREESIQVAFMDRYLYAKYFLESFEKKMIRQTIGPTCGMLTR